MTMDLNLAQTAEALSSPNQQLNLPTGPFTVVRPRRERTDEDREWYSKQLAVPHEKRIDKLVFERMAFYGSLNPERTAFPSVKRLADEAMCSPRSAQYALRRLETAGLIECLDDASGRTTSRGGRTTSRYCVAGAQPVHRSGATSAPEVLKEGTKRSKKTLSLNDDAQTIDPGAVEEVEMPEEVICLPFPSQEPGADEPYQHPKQVGMLCAVARKLGREVSEPEARAFDQLSHERKISTMAPLLAEEQLLAANGVVPPPPKATPSPRHEFPLPVARNTVRERPSCTEHRWTPPASDGVSNCYDCPEERKANDSV